MLYWAVPETEEEGRYLIAVLNSETARARISDIQSRGQFGARHFDKVMFTLPIPRFDASVGLHIDLAAEAKAAEAVATSAVMPDGVLFQRARKVVRDALTEAGISQKIDGLVERLLDD